MPSSREPQDAGSLPRLFLTLGDVAGVGPEIVCKAWASGELHKLCRPAVVGDVDRLRQLCGRLDLSPEMMPFTQADDWNVSQPDHMVCLQATNLPVAEVPLGRVDERAGRAAYEFLTMAIQRTLAGEADGIVTAPLHKEALHAAGLPYPGHTEILAEWTGTPRFAMMLYGAGLAVAHVTLHLALRQVFPLLTTANVLSKIQLLRDFLLRLEGKPPRIAVCGLNPHASDGGLFGDEEATIIAPAIAQAREQGIDATGPWPADTLFGRARKGEFQGIVCMYHDQGHIPMKLLAGFSAVNVSLGLPIVRTSVAHGTAFDIAEEFRADPASLIEATRVAARLCNRTLVPSPVQQ